MSTWKTLPVLTLKGENILSRLCTNISRRSSQFSLKQGGDLGKWGTWLLNPHWGAGAGSRATWEIMKSKSQRLTYKSHLAFWHIKTNSLGSHLLKIQSFRKMLSNKNRQGEFCSYSWRTDEQAHRLRRFNICWQADPHTPGHVSSLEPRGSSRSRLGLNPNSAPMALTHNI